MTSLRRGRIGALTICAFSALFFTQAAFAAEPVPFATASTPCGAGDETLTFPVQSASHPDAIMRFESIGSEGFIPDPGSYGVGDYGWGELFDPVEAGTAPQVTLDCDSPGSIRGSLADRPTTPATFSGRTTPTHGSTLPFIAPGSGQYTLDLAISQGAVSVFNEQEFGYQYWSTLQSSGEYPLGPLQAGRRNLFLQAQGGPPAIWTATVRALPVVINGLSFNQTCIAPGTGVPAAFSVTGDTTISATVRNSAGDAVRSLGSFGVRMGDGSIPWDGRDSSGAGVASGSYALDLVSSDPHGNSTSAQATVYVSRSGPDASMTSPNTIGPKQSVAFKVAETACGVDSVTVAIDGDHMETYSEEGSGYGYPGNPLPSGRVLIYSSRDGWDLGAHSWRIEATDRAGNTRVSAGRFTVGRAGRQCVVPGVVGRKLRVARRQIRASGCRVGTVKFKRKGTLRAGRVISVRPRAGTRRSLNSRVNLVVAKR